MRFIHRYFERVRGKSTVRQIFELAVVGFLCSIAASLIWQVLFGLPEVLADDSAAEEVAKHESMAFYALLAIVMAPIFETLIFQWLPLLFLRRFFPGNRRLLISVTALVFALAHVFNQPTPGLHHAFVRLPISLIFSWICLEKMGRSRLSAYLSTAATHAVYNAIPTLFAAMWALA